MLRRLAIRDFVLVERLELEFQAGFGALTGETGAGKSILLDALSLLLGSRADSGLVRQGCERAEVSGTFAPPADHPAHGWLAANDLPADEEILIRRIVDAGGRSRGYINGTPAAGNQLKELGELLADIHGQHAHHALLRNDAQRELLDAHAQAVGLARDVADRYRVWQEASRLRLLAAQQGEAAARERESLDWQLNEVRALNFTLEDWNATNDAHKRLSHSAGLIEGAGSALAQLDEGEAPIAGEIERLASALNELAAYDGRLTPVAELLSGAGIQLSEAASELRRYCDRMESDPGALREAEQRIAVVTQFARKYRVTPEEIPVLQAEWEARLAALTRAADLAALAAAEAAAQHAYLELARKLSAARLSAAAQLGQDVTAAMQSLAMAGGRFEIKLAAREEGGMHGLEDVEFLVAANPHQSPRPLAKVASGGELSRIGLSIQVIASRASSTPTLVFDEVDVGIGGRVAEIVGHHLHALGQQRQVLVVTHLPQVAAQADWQWQVAKTADAGGVRSTVSLLDRAARIEEIARMLGGVNITDTTRAHATELLGF